jgi:aryl-alcohol dehydrogenase-like predicted oxidoreductase
VAGPADWTSQGWYELAMDFAHGKYGLLVDSDHYVAYFENPGLSDVAGQVRYALPTMPEHYGYAVGRERAEATISAALAGPFNFIDTSNSSPRGCVRQRRALRRRHPGPGPDAQPRYAFEPAGPVVHDAVRAMQRACAAHGVPLAAAALQFSAGDPRVASTVVGVSTPSRIAETARLLTQPVPDELWAELDPASHGRPA